MRLVALMLTVCSLLLYFKPFLEQRYVPNSLRVGQKETVSSSLSEIRPIEDLKTYLASNSLDSKKENEDEVIQQKLVVGQSLCFGEDEPQENKTNQEEQEKNLGGCLKIGPVAEKKLSVLNKTLQDEGLLEKFSLEAVLGEDSWVVFIVPSSSRNGALALVSQVKKQGYLRASVIESGPLMNAVSLGEFFDEKKAQEFYQHALKKTKIQGLRLTRMIGQPTNQFFLVFSNLTKEQEALVKRVSERHDQKLTPCFE